MSAPPTAAPEDAGLTSEHGGAVASDSVTADAVTADAVTGRAASRLRAVSWRHWLREVAVIAAGALAALAAQAWWQDRQDRDREHDYLRQLLADTRENERRLDVAIVDDSLAARSQARIATALYAPGPMPPSDTIVRYLIGDRGALSASDFQPLTGTYAALQATGDLRLIRDDTTRARLVAYAARLESEREILRFLWQQAFGDISRVPRALPFMRGFFARGIDARAAHEHFDYLRHNPDMDVVLFALQASTMNRLSHLRGIRDETRHLRRVLDAAQAGARPSAARPTPRPK